MEFIKNFKEITKDMTDGEENYRILKKVFKDLQEEQVVIFNACETYYICYIEHLNDSYLLYSYYIDTDNTIQRNTNPLMKIDKTNKNIEDDIIAINDKEKFYTFTLVTNDMNKTEKEQKQDEGITILASLDDYKNASKRKFAGNTTSNVKKVKHIETHKPEPEATMVPMYDNYNPRRRIIHHLNNYNPDNSVSQPQKNREIKKYSPEPEATMVSIENNINSQKHKHIIRNYESGSIARYESKQQRKINKYYQAPEVTMVSNE